MSFSGWKEFFIKDVCNKISSGGTPSRKVESYFKNGTINWVKTQELKDCKIYCTDEKITEEALNNSSAKLFPINTVSMAMYGATVGKLGILKAESSTNQACCNMVANPNVLDYRFLYYTLIHKREELIGLASGAAQQNLNVGIISNFAIKKPTLYEQKAIAATLSCLDEKIELNNRINKNLEEMAQAIFKSWFVDFEPFQDGEFVDSELGRIPKGWRVGVLDEIIELFDSKRIPLSKRKRETMKKIYPYYGASSLMDFVDDYIFEGIYVLLGEDGTVIDKGYPILQYVWGRFWVNNHAHILKGKNGFNEDSIYMLLKNTNVQGIVTGAVQPKINQVNLKSVKVVIPAACEIKRYNQVIEPLFAKRRRATEETQVLVDIRDRLLPKLMRGGIRVPFEDVIPN